MILPRKEHTEEFIQYQEVRFENQHTMLACNVMQTRKLYLCI